MDSSKKALHIDVELGAFRERNYSREIRNIATDEGIREISLWGTYRAKKAVPPLPVHAHEHMEICFLKEGQQYYNIGGREYTLNAGDIFITWPGEGHSTGSHPQQRGTLYWMYLLLPKSTEPFLGIPAKEAKNLVFRLKNFPRRLFPGTEQLSNYFSDVWEILRNDNSDLRKLRLRATLVNLFLELVRNAVIPKGHLRDETVGEILEHIESHLSEPMTVPELAKLDGLSTSRFKAKFRKETGVPPWEYVLRRKMEIAKTLLAEYSVTETSIRLGMSSTQYFATVFRRYTNMSPSEYGKGLDKLRIRNGFKM